MSNSLVCQCLSAELPSMYQTVWSAEFCQSPSYPPCVKQFGLPVSVSHPVTLHVSNSLVCRVLSVTQLPSMCQTVWSAEFCQSPSYPPCIKQFGLPVSVSHPVTLHVSSSLVCQCLSVTQLPSMCQTVWSASVCQSPSYPPCVKQFGLPVSVSHPVTLHVSNSLVCQCLSVTQLPSMCQTVWSASVCQSPSYPPCVKQFWSASVCQSPSYPPCVKQFGLPVSVSHPVYGNVTCASLWYRC